jgi:hypothetical protein
MVNKTFILAFNQLEARSYIKKNPGEYTVLHSPDQLRMERTPRVMIMPNAYRREDYNDMMDAINIRRGIIVR